MTLAVLVIFALTVPLVCRSVDQTASVCQWDTTATALRVLTASPTSIATWENVLISKKSMTNAFTEMSAEDKRLASSITPAQLQVCALNT